jgi:hypothetical protein
MGRYSQIDRKYGVHNGVSMNIQNRVRKFCLRGYLVGSTVKHLPITLLLILLILQACSNNPSTINTTPAFEASQSITFEASPEPAQALGNNPTLESVYPPSTTPIPEPTQNSTYTPSPTSTETPTPEPTNTPTPYPPVVFAVIGDYGMGNQREADVANLVNSWKPEFIITVGDNNYPYGAWDNIDKAIGQYYHNYIYPYKGSYGDGADVNRFFPTLGNHDMLTDNGKPYFDYFSLPGNERYYDFVWGPVHFFALDNLDGEPDGVNATSIQGKWLEMKLAESTSPWNIVYMHYPPYSSGTHGSTDWARWPFSEWGVDGALAGHDHTYERLQENGMTYFVNGLGGAGIYNFINVLPGSQVRYNSDIGAMRVEATDNFIKFEFINRNNELVDSYEMNK